MNPIKNKIKIVKKAITPKIEKLRCGARVTKIEWLPGVKKPVVTYSNDYSFKEPKFEYLERLDSKDTSLCMRT